MERSTHSAQMMPAKEIAGAGNIISDNNFMEDNMDMQNDSMDKEGDAMDEGMDNGAAAPDEGAEGGEGRTCPSCGHSHAAGEACDCGCSD